MTTVVAQPSWMIIVLESSVVLLLLCSVLLFHLFRQSRNDHRIIREFVAAVHHDMQSRRHSLVDILGQRFRTGGPAVDTAIDAIVEIERDICRTIVNAYHHRDGISLLKAHSGLKRMLWASLDLVPAPHEFGTPENQLRFMQLERELAMLGQQKAQLEQKVRSNEADMRTLLAEYQRIFNKHQGDTVEARQTA